MRVGDSGLVVDYIVSKLRSYYPRMDSSDTTSWTPENTKYLRQYLIDYMPEMLKMMNLSSNNTELNLLYIDVVNGYLNSISLNPLMMSTETSTDLGSVDNYRGSPYTEYPLYTMSIPVEYGKKYKLLVSYNTQSYLYNPLDPNNNSWDLTPYAVYGITKGRLVSQFEPISTVKLIDESEIDKVSQNLITLKGDYALKVSQDMQVLSTDVLTIEPTVEGSSGVFYIGDTDYNIDANCYVKLEYDYNSFNVNITYYTSSGVIDDSKEVVVMKPSQSISFSSTTTTVPRLSRNDIEVDLSVLSDIVITIKEIYSAGVLVDSSLNLLGTQLVKGLPQPLTGISSNPTELPDEIPKDTIFSLDGVTYQAIGKLTRSIQTVEVYDKNFTKDIKIDISIDSFSELNDNISLAEAVNDSHEGYNLLIQLPVSVTNVSLVEIADSVDGWVDVGLINIAEVFSDSSVVTPDYLDLILLDRTITKYSSSDDIEWAQDLSEGHHEGFLGVYDNTLRNYIKEVQSTSKIDGGLGRSTYVTGWVDPETEILLETRIGY